VMAGSGVAITYRIDDLLVIGARVIVVAKAKAGKTTLRDNLVRSLADGDPFLDTFGVTPPAGNVVLIDDEMSDRSVRRALRRQGVEQQKRVKVLCLRGRVAEFNIMDPTVRAGWAADLKALGCGVLIFDCIGPVMTALGLDENHDAGAFLDAINALLHEAGCPAAEAVVFHHMGHNGERARGDSRLRGTPDAEWKIVQPGSEDDDLDAPRFFRAFGRDDVDVHEGALDLDKATNRLTYRIGNRKQDKGAAATAAAEAALPAVIQLLTGGAELSGRAIQDALESSGHSRGSVRAAMLLGVEKMILLTTPGPRNSILHLINPCHD
jgi:hypothetical protein